MVEFAKTAAGLIDSPHSQDRSTSSTFHITQLDWDKFDFMYSLEDQPFHYHDESPQHSPPKSNQQTYQHLPKQSTQPSYKKSSSLSVPKEQPLTEAQERINRKRIKDAEYHRERRKHFKINDPSGYKAYNRSKNLANKPKKEALRATYSEERKKELKVVNAAYQARYRQRVKSQTGYTKRVDHKYHLLKDLVQQNKATPEQINHFEMQREKKRNTVRMSRWRRKQKTQSGTPKSKD